MATKNSFCSFCGHPFSEGLAWPRRCGSCGNTSYINPLPVAVLLQPVGAGVLVIRRGIEPKKGQLALPGGFIDVGESWQSACARELHEETGVRIDPDAVTEFRVMSAPDGTVLIFGRSQIVLSADALPTFAPTNETTERAVIDAPQPLAFELHTAAVEAYFSR